MLDFVAASCIAPHDFDRFLKPEEFNAATATPEQTRFFKLECLPEYAEDTHNEAYRSFIAGDIAKADKLLEDMFSTAGPYYEHFRTRAIRFERVRIVEVPLTRYVQFELRGLIHAVRLGENVHILELDSSMDLDTAKLRDFIIMDNRIYLHRFDPEFEYCGSWEIVKPILVEKYQDYANRLLDQSVPLTLALLRERFAIDVSV